MKKLTRWIGGGIFESSPAGAVPGEIQLFPAGEITMKGQFKPTVVDEAGMNAVIARFEADGEDIPFDYEHQTLGKLIENGRLVRDFTSPDGTAPAAGWIKGLVNKGPAGLWATVEWTERAAKLLSERAYRYFSPVFFTSPDGRLAMVTSVALTNAPKLPRLQALVAKDGTNDGAGAGATTGAAEGSGAPREEESMLKDQLIEALGLDAGASDEDIVAAVNALKGQGGDAEAPPAEAVAAKLTLDKLATALGVPAKGLEAHVAKLQLNAAGGHDLAAKVADLAAWKSDRVATDLLEGASNAGKLTPAMKGWAMKYAKQDPQGFADWEKTAAVVAEPGRLNVAKLDPPGKGGARTPESLALQKKLRISDKDWETYGQKK